MKSFGLTFCFMVSSVASENPPSDDSYALFDDVDFPIIEAGPSTKPLATTNHPDDWCYEYDEIRFRIDAGSIAINVAQRHHTVLGNVTRNTVHYINSRLVMPGHARFELCHVDKLAGSSGIPDELMTPVRSAVDALEPSVGITSELVTSLLRKILYPSNTTLNNYVKAVLLSRFIVGVGLLQKKNLIEFHLQTRLRNELLRKVYDNEDAIRVCFERRLKIADEGLVALSQRQEFETLLSRKFEAVRQIIVDTIQKFSVSMTTSRASAELRIACLESARQVMFRKMETAKTPLPILLKKNLKQKSWDFLVVWLEALDHLHDEQEAAKTRVAKRVVDLEYSKNQSQSMIERIGRDSAEGLALLAEETSKEKHRN